MINLIKEIKIQTEGQEIINITSGVEKIIKEFNLEMGLVNLSVLHTSASLFVQENTSSDVLRDISDFINDLVPESSNYRHDMEGPDDMPAHIKSLLTNSNLTFSVENNNILLGRWQGIFLYEHRAGKRTRVVAVHLMGS